MIGYIRENFWPKAVIGFVFYMMVAGLTNSYVVRYDPDCNSIYPNERSYGGGGDLIASFYWPLYWPFQLGQIISGYESTCADSPLQQRP